MRIAFLGDISFNDHYNDLYQRGENPFDEIGAFLKQNDYIVGNLECMAKGDKGENLLKAPRLKTNIETLNYLNDIGVNVVELAHNHVFDNLKDGFKKTINFLDKNKIQYLGASDKKGEEKEPLILEQDGISVCLLNYVTKDTNPNLPKDADVYPNWFDEERIIQEIQKYKQKYNYVFLLLHWGGRMEGSKYPDWHQPQQAKRLIDAGADMIIGNHSHTIQPYEIYKGKYIFYSLGNFCFSAVVFEGRVTNYMHAKKNCISLLPFVEIMPDRLLISVSFSQRIPQTNYLIIAKNKLRCQHLCFRLIFATHIIWRLYCTYIKKIKPIFSFLFSKEISFRKKIRKIKMRLNQILNRKK